MPTTNSRDRTPTRIQLLLNDSSAADKIKVVGLETKEVVLENMVYAVDPPRTGYVATVLGFLAKSQAPEVYVGHRPIPLVPDGPNTFTSVQDIAEMPVLKKPFLPLRRLKSRWSSLPAFEKGNDSDPVFQMRLYKNGMVTSVYTTDIDSSTP